MLCRLLCSSHWLSGTACTARKMAQSAAACSAGSYPRRLACQAALFAITSPGISSSVKIRFMGK